MVGEVRGDASGPVSTLSPYPGPASGPFFIAPMLPLAVGAIVPPLPDP